MAEEKKYPFGTPITKEDYPFGTPITDESNRPLSISGETEDDDPFSQAFNATVANGGAVEYDSEGNIIEKTGGSLVEKGTGLIADFITAGGQYVDGMLSAPNMSPNIFRSIQSSDTDLADKERRQAHYLKLLESQGAKPEELEAQKEVLKQVHNERVAKVANTATALAYNASKDLRELNFTDSRLEGDVINAFQEGDASGVFEATLGTILDVGFQAVAARATGGASMYVQGVGGTLNEMIDKGIEEGRTIDEITGDGSALVTSLVTGTIIGKLENIGLEGVFSKLGKPMRDRLGTIAARGLKGFLTEAPTEGLQELAQIVGVDYALDNQTDMLRKVADALDDPTKQHRILNAVILGGIGGHVMGSIGGTFEKTLNQKEKEELRAIIKSKGDEIKATTGKDSKEVIKGVLTILDENKKKAEEKESVERVEGIAPKTRADVRRALYKFFDFKEDNVEHIEQVERITDLTMAMVSTAAKAEGISNREWFQKNIAQIRKGLPNREGVLDRLSQLVFHGGKESIEGINAKTKSLGGYLHLTSNLGVAFQFGSKWTSAKGIINAFNMNDKVNLLDVQDTGETYHIKNVAMELLKFGKAISKDDREKLSKIARWVEAGKPTSGDAFNGLVDTGVLTSEDIIERKNILSKTFNEFKNQPASESLISTKTSEILMKYGFDGIRYENYLEPGTRPGGYSYVDRTNDTEFEGVPVSEKNYSYAIANPNALIKLKEFSTKDKGMWFGLEELNSIKKEFGKEGYDLLYQNDFDYKKAHAAVTFYEDGRVIISALNSPNASSFIHELAHVFGRKLSEQDKKTVMKWAKQTEWNVETEEKFARGFERYLAEGRSPVTSLELVFEKFKRWMADIYEGITNSPIDIEISKEVQSIFDQLVGAEKAKPKTTKTEAKTNASVVTSDAIKAKEKEIAGWKEGIEVLKDKNTPTTIAALEELISKGEKELEKLKEDANKKSGSKKVDVGQQAGDGEKVGEGNAKKEAPKETKAEVKKEEQKVEPTPTKKTQEQIDAEEEAAYEKFKKDHEEFNKWFDGLKDKDEYFHASYVKKINSFLAKYSEDLKPSEIKTLKQYIEEYADLRQQEQEAKTEEAKIQRKIKKLDDKLDAKKFTKGEANQIDKYLEDYPDFIDEPMKEKWLEKKAEWEKGYEEWHQKAAENKAKREAEAAAIEEAKKKEGVSNEEAKKIAKQKLKVETIKDKAKVQAEKKSKTVDPIAKKMADYLNRAAKVITKKNATYEELKQAISMLDAIYGPNVDAKQTALRMELLTEAKALMAGMKETQSKTEFSADKHTYENLIEKLYTEIEGLSRQIKGKDVNLASTQSLVNAMKTATQKLDNAIAEWNKIRVDKYKKSEVSADALDRFRRNGINNSLYGSPDVLFQSNENEDVEDELDMRLRLIGKLVTDSDPNKYVKQAKQGHRVGKTISADILDIVKSIREYMGMSLEEGMEKLAELQQKVDDEGREYTKEEMTKLELLNFVGFEGATIEQLQRANEVLEQILTEGKSQKAVQIQAINNEKILSSNLATATILGIPSDQVYNPYKTYVPGDVVFHKGTFREINEKGVPVKERSDLEKAIKSTAKIKGKQISKRKGLMWIERISRDFQTRLESLPSLLDKLAFMDKTSKMFETPLHRLISTPLRRATTQEKTMNNSDMTMVRAAAEKIFGKDWRKEMRKNSVPRDTKLLLKDGTLWQYADGSLPKLSQNQLAYMWLSWQQADVRKSMEDGNGFGVETIEGVEKHLNESTRKWAEWQRDVFYKDSSKSLREAYRDAYGVDLPLVDNYVPVNKVVEKAENASVSSTGDSGFMNPSEVLNHFKERKDTKAPLELVDMDAVLFRYILKANHFKAFYKPARVFRSIVNNRDFRSAVRADFGDTAVNVLQRFANDITSGGAKIENSMKALEVIRRNLVMSTLGLNLSMFPKQMSSLVAYAAHMPTAQWTKHEALFWANPYKNTKEILNLPFIKDRLDAGNERDMLELIKTEGVAGKNRKRNLMDKAMIITKAGDVGAIIVGGWPLYNYYRQKFGDEVGYEKFVDATSNTQQSGDLMDLSDIQRGNAMNKLFTTFMTTPLQYFRLGSMATRRLIQGRGSTKENVKVVGMYMFVLPALFSIASGTLAGAFSDDDEEKKDAWFDFGLDSIAMWLGQGIPVWNSVLNSFVGSMKGEKYPFRLTPAQKSFEDFIKAGNTAIDFGAQLTGGDAPDADAWVDFMKELAVASSTLSGIPLKAPAKSFFNAIEMATGENHNPFASKADKKKSKTTSSLRSARRKIHRRK